MLLLPSSILDLFGDEIILLFLSTTKVSLSMLSAFSKSSILIPLDAVKIF